MPKVELAVVYHMTPTGIKLFVKSGTKSPNYYPYFSLPTKQSIPWDQGGANLKKTYWNSFLKLKRQKFK